MSDHNYGGYLSFNPYTGGDYWLEDGQYESIVHKYTVTYNNGKVYIKAIPAILGYEIYKIERLHKKPIYGNSEEYYDVDIISNDTIAFDPKNVEYDEERKRYLFWVIFYARPKETSRKVAIDVTYKYGTEFRDTYITIDRSMPSGTTYLE